jgi:hypothetical protein
MFDSNWKDTPRLAGPMMEAFRIMRDIQELRQLLEAATALPLPAPIADERSTWLEMLNAEGANGAEASSATARGEGTWSLDALHAFSDAGAASKIRTWLRSLSEHIQR